MKFFIIVIFTFISFVANAQTKDEILKHHFEKMGASAKWLTINSMKVESLNINSESDTTKHVKFAKKPNLAKIELNSNIRKPVHVLVCADSLGAWQRINNNDVERISTYGIDFIQTDMTIFIANELKNTGNIQLKRNEILNGKEYHILDIKNNTVIRRLLYINTKTYMIDAYRSVDYENGSELSDIITTFLLDYRDVKGFLFPFQSFTEIAGSKSKRIVTNLQINIPIDNKIFSPESK